MPQTLDNVFSNYPGMNSVISARAVGEGYTANNGNSVANITNNPGDIRSFNGNTAGLGTYGPEQQIIYPDIDTGRLAQANNVLSYVKQNPDITFGEYVTKWVGSSSSAAAVAGDSAALGIDPNTPLKDVLANPNLPNIGVNYATHDPPASPMNVGVAGSGAGGSLFTRNATQAQPVELDSPTVNYDSLFPDVVINTGLNETPWYADPDLVTGNPKVRGSINPVVFELVLKGRDEYLLSTSTNTSIYTPGTPLQIQLNASMKTFNTTMKHVYHPQRTRVGWHITFWGMQADIIEGNCTTGVFMNQFGLTDFFSTNQMTDDIAQLLESGFRTFTAGGNVTSTLSSNFPTASSQLSQQIQAQTKQDPTKAFRVAAQDAFVEFLSLFKNNGNVWFNTQASPLGTTTDASGQINQQVGVDEWSPQTALTATNMNARNNDIMTRGSVVMKFKGTTYLGYFKSLSWQMDAANPFQWTFNFVFQVEKTIGYIFSPGYQQQAVVTTKIITTVPTS